jgi:hypothetical protein
MGGRPLNQLQIAKEKAEVANQAKSVYLANISHPETLNGNILIVDDQLPNLRLLVSILTGHGYACSQIFTLACNSCNESLLWGILSVRKDILTHDLLLNMGIDYQKVTSRSVFDLPSSNLQAGLVRTMLQTLKL